MTRKCLGFAVVFVLMASFQVTEAQDDPPEFVLEWGGYGSGPGQLDRPRGIDVDDSDTIFVADRGNCRIQRFNTDGTYLGEWGTCGGAEGQFDGALGISTDSDGNVFVSDYFNYRIQKFDNFGNFLLMWGWGVSTGAEQFEVCTENCRPGIAGSGAGQFNRPHSVRVSSGGTVYVADVHNGRIVLFDRSGNYISAVGSPGEGEGQFRLPAAIAQDSNGNFYVAEVDNARVQRFSDDWNVLLMWGWGVATGAAQFETCTQGCQGAIPGGGPGQFIAPKDVNVDTHDTIYVVDTNNSRIQEFGPGGVFLTQWGTGGSAPGQFYSPWGIAFDSRGNMYVTDSDNHRVQKFAPPTPLVSCDGFQPPMANYPVKVKGSRALPLKANLWDTDGYEMTDLELAAPPVIQVWFESAEGGDPIDVTDDALPLGQGDDGNQCVYDGEQWHFNLKTSNYTSPGTYIVTLESGDDAEYRIDPSCETQFVVK